MSKELEHMRNPAMTYIKWSIFYIALVIALLATWYFVTKDIRSYSAPTGNIVLSLPYQRYLLGETVGFTIKNKLNSDITIINTCPSEPLAVYRFESKRWTRIHSKIKAKDCEKKEREIVIPANGQRSASFAAWPDLFATPGKYRLVAYVENFTSLPYQDLEVVKKPTIPKVPSTSASSSGQSTAQAASGDTTNQPSTTTVPQNTLKSAVLTVRNANGSTAGTVSVKYDNSRVYLQSVSTSCRYETSGGGELEITFKCGGSETQLQLWVSGGRLQQKIEQGD